MSAPATILTVEDSPAIRRMIAYNLERHGYNVLQAGDGKEAVRTLQGTVPDLIILDVRMPEMNGFQLLELMRRYPKAAAIPVIMLSALSQPENIDQTLSLVSLTIWSNRWIPTCCFQKSNRRLRAFMALPKVWDGPNRRQAKRMALKDVSLGLSRVAELWISAKVVWRGGPKAHPKSATACTLRPMSCSKLSGLKTVTFASEWSMFGLLAWAIIRSGQPIDYHRTPRMRSASSSTSRRSSRAILEFAGRTTAPHIENMSAALG